MLLGWLTRGRCACGAPDPGLHSVAPLGLKIGEVCKRVGVSPGNPAADLFSISPEGAVADRSAIAPSGLGMFFGYGSWGLRPRLHAVAPSGLSEDIAPHNRYTTRSPQGTFLISIMRLKRVEISNYKSLKSVAIEPTPLCVLVGPNAAGKTNFGDALDFLGHIYKWNLASAVETKGGLENITYRDESRSQKSLKFKISLELGEGEWFSVKNPSGVLEVVHSFEFRANSKADLTSFRIFSETLDVRLIQDTIQDLIRIKRSDKGSPEVEFPKQKILLQAASLDSSLAKRLLPTLSRQTKSLLLPFIDQFYLEGVVSNKLGTIRVFQLNPRDCRAPGVPSPSPDLDRFGKNLPATLSYLKNAHSSAYNEILEALRRVMPSIQDIKFDFTHTKALGLFLKEQGVSKLWTAEEISDGTIQAIALLTATFDPRIPLVVIEEPENSVHPWAVRNFVEAFRRASRTKQIILTTHSPIVVDQLQPEEIWVVQRTGTETKIDPLLSLDPSLKEAWGQGKFTLSEYLDSGAVPEAVPAVNS